MALYVAAAIRLAPVPNTKSVKAATPSDSPDESKKPAIFVRPNVEHAAETAPAPSASVTEAPFFKLEYIAYPPLISTLQIIESCFSIVDISAIAQRIIGQGTVFIGRSGIDRQYSAPCVVFVVANDAITICDSDYITL